MAAKHSTTTNQVPLRQLRAFARAVAERFDPDKIVLFGSYAWGTPGPDSDVDILVVMPTRNQLDQAYKIRLAVPAPFAMDLIVRTPQNIAWRLAEGESFLTQIMTHGKVLYEKNDTGMAAKSGSRSSRRQRSQRKN
jgi:uncharacterized protein